MSEQGPTVFGGRYELHRRLAKGGMAEVFLAKDQLLDRPVAVKVLFPQLAADPSFVERFRREAQSAANLSHPNIVGVYDWGREGSTYYIGMEYVQGRSLSEVIRDEGPLDPVRAAEIASEMAAALGFAHKNDFVHCDMKSGNVMVTPSGHVKVADFGIAKAISGGGQSKLTQTGAVMGTATYFSPEQAQGQPLDGRSDLYSLGVVLYEMLTGSPPFTGENPVAIAYKHVQETPDPVGARRPGIPEAIQAITAKLLNKDPAGRYPQASDLQSDLRRFLAGEHTISPSPAPPAAASSDTGAPPVVPISGGPGQAPPGAPPVTPVAPGYPAGGPYAPAGYGAYPDDSQSATTQMGQVAPPPQVVRGPREPEPYDPYYDYDEPDRRTWLWVLLSTVLLGVLIALIIVLINVTSDDGGGGADDVTTMVRVPQVVQLDRQEAIARLEQAGLRVGQITTEESSDFPVDLVIGQDPEAGTEVEEGDPVDLVVVVGPDAKPVPSVVGLTEADARVTLAAAGFENIRTETVEADEEEGIVVEQVPSANEEVDVESEILLRVSGGPGAIQIPNIEGQAEADGVRILEELGWIVEIERVESQDIREGFVVGTDPSAGNELEPGEIIRLLVSSGPGVVRVPNVLGLTAEEAARVLEADGLRAVPDVCIIDDPDTQVPGQVIEQTPSGGVEIEVGMSVTICVGVEPDPTPTPEPDEEE